MRFKVISHYGRFISKSYDLDMLSLEVTEPELAVNVIGRPRPEYSITRIRGYKGTSFVVEEAVDQNCYSTSVKGLNIPFCLGRIHVRDVSGSDVQTVA